MSADGVHGVVSRVVQITDSHLFADPAECLQGMPTSESLAAVVESVLAEQRDVRLLLATGDISQDGSIESYRQFAAQVDAIGAPMRWLPGNHDEVPVLQEATGSKDWAQPVFDLPGWKVLLLDSTIPGAVYGYLREDQLQLLENTLAAVTDSRVLVCLHHHPFPSGSRWLDRIGLHNMDEFFAVLDRFDNVGAVLWGHIHQEMDRVRNGVRLLGSPSSCIQFAPDSEDYSLDDRQPGYRWLDLHADGRIETGISRLQQPGWQVDLSGNGY